MDHKSKNLTIAVLGSHSALDICRGAKDLGFKTLVIAQKGREKTYANYYKSDPSSLSSLGGHSLGCVDEGIVLDKFADILNDDIQNELISRNVVFVPNRSFEVYVNNYNAIETKFNVPMYGNKFLLKIEERGVNPNQYDLLDIANIRYPKQFKDPKDIDRVVLVKVLEQQRGYERAFFLAESFEDFTKQKNTKTKAGIFSEEQLSKAVVEEFVVGIQVNFNFFYSNVNKRLELLGTDTRRQTNIEGILKLPSQYQQEILQKVEVKYEEAGHIAVTVLESMLEDIFAMGERFVQATKKMNQEIIGPFGLQSIIIPGPPKKDIVVVDVSPRMPGSPGIFATPYSGYLYGENMSMGKRVAMEIREALEKGKLSDILT